ncbi:DNA-directed DNA polymerase [Planctopirus limnophila DSM 3776]|uniref:DNA-directed DNA polymerase n=1 Tax=Planctopirus limnophila (strain ATCC 43296 / DSM 3776 / IFAM 1008 / Mu 290) TaxID=521674 RepID=D5SSV2_PLAL2|nr:DNA-directed DNA polymerase [Planctopirus limnophila DSM 3776]
MRIANPGQRRTVRFDPQQGREVITGFGEEFVLNCPFCRDQRSRMRVSETYYPTDQSRSHRWHCFNESCHTNGVLATRFNLRISSVWREAQRSCAGDLWLPTTTVLTPGDAVVPIVLPPEFLSLTDSTSNHDARNYLTSRNFDPEQLARDWNVGYVDESDSSQPRIVRRLIIPFYQIETLNLVGWQARAIEQSDQPKYLTATGFRKSLHLYGMPGVTDRSEIVVVEGVTDAWRIGRNAVALLGKSASQTQLDLLVDLASKASAVLVALDRDAETDAMELIGRLQRQLSLRAVSKRVLRCLPPDGRKDFGECRPEEVEHALRQARADAGLLSQSAGTIIIPPARDVSRLPIASAISRPPGMNPLQVIQHTGRELTASARLDAAMNPILRKIEQHGLLLDERWNPSSTNDLPELKRMRLSAAPTGGRLRTRLSQNRSRTGRITASQYSCQSIPLRLRPAVVVGEGRTLISADYRAFEWRVAAALSQDSQLLTDFGSPDFDLYAFLVSQFDDLKHDVSSARPIIKGDSIQALYDFIDDGTASDGKTSVAEAIQRLFPRLMTWRQSVAAEALSSGFVTTPLGRVIDLTEGQDDLNRQRQAVNNLIQAHAAELFKQALIAMDQRLPPGARILLPMHDGVLVDCLTHQLDAVARGIRAAMTGFSNPMPVPLQVVIETGQNWGALQQWIETPSQ